MNCHILFMCIRFINLYIGPIVIPMDIGHPQYLFSPYGAVERKWKNNLVNNLNFYVLWCYVD